MNCPWGCSEFLHKTGNVPFDVMYATFLSLCDIPVMSKLSKKCNLHSMMEDFYFINMPRLFFEPNMESYTMHIFYIWHGNVHINLSKSSERLQAENVSPAKESIWAIAGAF